MPDGQNGARRNKSEDDITAEVLARFSTTPDPRLRQIMLSLIGHLHAFIKEVQLTEAEWFQAIEILTEAGKMCSDKRQEFILFSDTLGLSALVVFFGIRSYRENAGAGQLTFGRGVAVGLLITLVSCACYVVAFQIVYFKAAPGVGEKYAACMVERVRASGASQQKVDEMAKKARSYKQMYDNPAINAALAFAEMFPIGLVVTAASAGIRPAAMISCALPASTPVSGDTGIRATASGLLCATSSISMPPCTEQIDRNVRLARSSRNDR